MFSFRFCDYKFPHNNKYTKISKKGGGGIDLDRREFGPCGLYYITKNPTCIKEWGLNYYMFYFLGLVSSNWFNVGKVTPVIFLEVNSS